MAEADLEGDSADSVAVLAEDSGEADHRAAGDFCFDFRHSLIKIYV